MRNGSLKVTVLQFLLSGSIELRRRVIGNHVLVTGATGQHQAQRGGSHQIFHTRHDVLIILEVLFRETVR
ncbi:hypothetical protein DJ61_4255 [Yersinia enterocolitica]|nr:hypothetical protein DJ61_4255 [Yersinia enterocolitica]